MSDRTALEPQPSIPVARTEASLSNAAARDAAGDRDSAAADRAELVAMLTSVGTAC